VRADEEKRQAYVDALCREIGFIASKIKDSGEDIPVADTVYFGGGTPTLLTAAQFSAVLDTIDQNFGIVEDAEITAEANPKTADGEKLSLMRKAGINRLSIGMQSVHDGELKKLGRIHTFGNFVSIFDAAREAGFDNISADLMYGIPDQSRESFAQSVRTLAELDPEHISSYCLTVEEGTRFYRKRHTLNLPDEDTVSDMYADMTSILSDFGYKKYEISNFSHKDKQSRHNLKYWQRAEYLGFGPAAHSFFSGVRYGHSRDVDAYIAGKSIYSDVQYITGREQTDEYVMLRMRLADGVDIAEFERLFGGSFDAEYGKKLSKYAPEYVTMDTKTCKFTDKGMFVSNFILSDVLDFDTVE
jgi:oxygen-independent coproporphyrinogen-3 oxidase